MTKKMIPLNHWKVACALKMRPHAELSLDYINIYFPTLHLDWRMVFYTFVERKFSLVYSRVVHNDNNWLYVTVVFRTSRTENHVNNTFYLHCLVLT